MFYNRDHINRNRFWKNPLKKFVAATYYYAAITLQHADTIAFGLTIRTIGLKKVNDYSVP